MKFSKSNILSFLPHLIFVVSILFIAAFYDPRPKELIQNDAEGFQDFLLVTAIAVLVCYYVNMFVLIPQVLNKKGWFIYLLVIGIVSFAILLILNIAGFIQNDAGRPVAPILFFLLVAFSGSASIRLNADRVKSNEQRKIDEYESLKSELSLLRSQITPHFMFNVLNTLTSLARKKSDDMEDVIIRISNLMRYMLYNTREKKITLAKEIEFLNSYLGIQKLRFGNSIDVSFQSNISDPGYLVESMLLLPLIENAFKHGTGTVNPSIIIKLLAKKGTLEFEIINSFNPDLLTIKEASGIGNKNVQKRLSFLYKDKHEFISFTKDDTFTTKLNLILV